MESATRFDHALLRLYQAFNNGNLHPEDACRCAVGSILKGKDFWKNFSDDHGSTQLNYVGQIHETFGRTFEGYRPSELLEIEVSFLKGAGFELPYSYQSIKPEDPADPSIQFNGLMAAIETLSKLDNRPLTMDIAQLFEDVKMAKVGIEKRLEIIEA